MLNLSINVIISRWPKLLENGESGIPKVDVTVDILHVAACTLDSFLPDRSGLQIKSVSYNS